MGCGGEVSRREADMSEKPQKRLVSKGQYLQIMAKKIALYSLAAVLAFYGALISLTNIYATVHDAFYTCCQDEPESAIPLGAFTPSQHVYFLGLGVFLFLLSTALFWFGHSLFTKARKIEPVALIRQHNTGHLPEVETLVRGSEEPPVAQSDILLRAATSAKETPPEQLLRSSEAE